MSPRDFRKELAGEACWDATTQAVFEDRGEAVQDRILQNREELIRLCEFIEAEGVRSYLEIGVWTGRLVSCLQRLFRFDKVAACDHGWAERFGLPIQLPPEARYLKADSDSEAFLRFRRELGPVDLVFIDANHAYPAVRRDFEINRAFDQRYIALHDIAGANRYTQGVRRFWNEIEGGRKIEILEPHRELDLPLTTMGIGIWSAG